MADVTFTVDAGKKLTAGAPGRCLIDACKNAAHRDSGLLCYYPNLSLQAACRMCVVRIEKMRR